MIRVIPFDERDEDSRRAILRPYLKLLAMGTRFDGKALIALGQKFGFSEEEATRVVGKTEKEQVDFPESRTRDYLYRDGDLNVDRLYTLLTVPMVKEIWGESRIPDEVIRDSHAADFFVYKNISGKPEMYDFTRAMKTPVCPYCNRVFTSTIQEDDGKTVVRPEIDHFMSKSVYPIFSMSIMNWIPSCPICNRRKGTNENLLYPYLEEVGANCTFETSPVDASRGIFLTGQENSEESFEIVCAIHENIPDASAYAPLTKRLKAKDISTDKVKEEYIKRLRNSANLFGWHAVAQSHKAYVLKMYRREYAFGKAYQNSLTRSFHELFTDESLTYLRSIKRENWGESPLSKLTYDIDQEIKGLR